ncbi:MAG: hypothetical protein AAFV72_06475 [Cyanobacteria bacterium J06635_1]
MARLILAREIYYYSHSFRTEEGPFDKWLAQNKVESLPGVPLTDNVLKGYSEVLPNNIQLKESDFEANLKPTFKQCEITTLTLWNVEKGEPHKLYVTVADQSEFSKTERNEIHKWLGTGSSV